MVGAGMDRAVSVRESRATIQRKVTLRRQAVKVDHGLAARLLRA